MSKEAYRKANVQSTDAGMQTVSCVRTSSVPSAPLLQETSQQARPSSGGILFCLGRVGSCDWVESFLEVVLATELDVVLGLNRWCGKAMQKCQTD